MWNHVHAIAVNTYREAIRARVIYVLMLGGLLSMAASTVLSPVALGESERITKDIGLTTIDVLGLIVITFLGTTIVYKEIEKRTIMVLLSKPIRRVEFVLGKFFGLAMTLALVVVSQSAVLLLIDFVGTGAMDARILYGSGMAYLMLLTMTAVAVLYTTFAGPTVAAFLTLSTFVVGQLADQLADFATDQHLPMLKAFFYVLPNLASMDVRAEIVHGFGIDSLGVALAIAHGLSYMVAALALAVVAFSGRQFR